MTVSWGSGSSVDFADPRRKTATGRHRTEGIAVKSVRPVLVSLTAIFYPVVVCPPALPADKTEIVNKARAKYYSLPSHGVKDFRCNAAINWKKFLASNRNKPVSDEDPFLKRLNLLRFEVEATLSDEPRVTPSTIGAIVLDNDVMQLITGVKQTVQGFFETWRGFMITNPFDGCDVDSLVEGPDSYQISSKGPGLEARTVMRKDFTITDILADSGESKVRVAPKFIVTKEGLLLESVNNEIDGGKTRLGETIEYAEVEGLKLPARVHIDAIQPAGRFVIDVAFDNYRIGRK